MEGREGRKRQASTITFPKTDLFESEYFPRTTCCGYLDIVSANHGL